MLGDETGLLTSSFPRGLCTIHFSNIEYSLRISYIWLSWDNSRADQVVSISGLHNRATYQHGLDEASNFSWSVNQFGATLSNRISDISVAPTHQMTSGDNYQFPVDNRQSREALANKIIRCILVSFRRPWYLRHEFQSRGEDVQYWPSSPQFGLHSNGNPIDVDWNLIHVHLNLLRGCVTFLSIKVITVNSVRLERGQPMLKVSNRRPYSSSSLEKFCLKSYVPRNQKPETNKQQISTVNLVILRCPGYNLLITWQFNLQDI